MLRQTIYIPQSRSASLERTALDYEIGALYTDGFSTCNIIAIITENKLALIHADQSTLPHHITEQIDWAGDTAQIVWIRRKAGRHIYDNLIPFFGDYAARTQLSIMDDAHDGVYLSFDVNAAFDMHPNIKKYPLRVRPEGLLHHPDEQAFTAVVKCTQIIGMRERYRTHMVGDKTALIFDEGAWINLDKSEMRLESESGMTKEEIDFFSASDDYVTVIGKLCGVVQSIGAAIVLGESMQDFAFPIAVHLEGLLNDFDAKKLFSKNLTKLLTRGNHNNIYGVEEPVSAEDREIISQILKTLKNRSIANHYQAIQDLVEAYETHAPATTFKKQLIDEITIFSKHYTERTYYADYNANALKKLETARRYSEEGIAKYRESQAAEALEDKARLLAASKNLFMDAIKLATCFATMSDSDFALYHFNMGRCCHHMGEYNDALQFLKKALLLQQRSKAPAASITKTEKAIAEAESKMQPAPVLSTISYGASPS